MGLILAGIMAAACSSNTQSKPVPLESKTSEPAPAESKASEPDDCGRVEAAAGALGPRLFFDAMGAMAEDCAEMAGDGEVMSAALTCNPLGYEIMGVGGVFYASMGFAKGLFDEEREKRYCASKSKSVRLAMDTTAQRQLPMKKAIQLDTHTQLERSRSSGVIGIWVIVSHADVWPDLDVAELSAQYLPVGQ